MVKKRRKIEEIQNYVKRIRVVPPYRLSDFDKKTVIRILSRGTENYRNFKNNILRTEYCTSEQAFKYLCYSISDMWRNESIHRVFGNHTINLMVMSIAILFLENYKLIPDVSEISQCRNEILNWLQEDIHKSLLRGYNKTVENVCTPMSD